MSDRIPIVLDIETRADEEWLRSSEDLWRATAEPPANYRKPDAIHRWFVDHAAERLERAPLSPQDGLVYAVGIAPLWDDDETLPIVYAGRDEAEILRHLDNWMRFIGEPVLCGFEIRRFDLPFLAVRYAAHGIDAHWLPDLHDRHRVLDAEDVLRGGKLATWLARFGLPAKLASGADVARMGVLEVQEYCAQDVRAEKALLRRLAPVFPSLRRTRPEPKQEARLA